LLILVCIASPDNNKGTRQTLAAAIGPYQGIVPLLAVIAAEMALRAATSLDNDDDDSIVVAVVGGGVLRMLMLAVVSYDNPEGNKCRMVLSM